MANRKLDMLNMLAPVVIFVAFGIRLIHLGGSSLWYDEAFSLAVAGAGWPVFWAALLSDAVHPPGYYLLLKGCLVLFGAGEYGLRFLSVVTGTLAVACMWRLGRCLGRRRWGLAAAVLLALNPFAIWYAREARMYSLLLFLIVCCGYTFWRLSRRPNLRNWLWFTLVTGLSFLVHYFALLFSLAQFVYLLFDLRRNPRVLRWWASAQLAAGLPFGVWAFIIASREGRNFGIGWIPSTSLLDVPLTFVNLGFGWFDPTYAWTWLGLGFLVAAAGVGVFVYLADSPGKSVRSLRLSTCCLLLSWLLVPVLFTWLISLRLPVYVDRFLIVCLPPLLLLISTLVLSSTWVSRGIMVVLVAASLAAGARLWLDPSLAKEDWRAAAAYVQQSELAGDGLVMRDFQTGIPFGYYYRGSLAPQVATTNRQTRQLDELAADHDRLWLVYRRPFESTHRLAGSFSFEWQDESEPDVQTWLISHQESLVDEVSFPGVYLVLYQLLPAAQ